MAESTVGSIEGNDDPSGVGGHRPSGPVEKVREVVRYIPDGTTIPKEMWGGRHRNILIAIVVQVPLLIALGLYEGTESLTGAEIPAAPAWMLGGFTALILGTAALSNWSRLGRRQRTVLAAFSAMTVSMALVKLSGDTSRRTSTFSCSSPSSRSMSQATAEADSLAERAERLQALLRGFEIGDESPDDPPASGARNVAVGDGGQAN